jgi:hypothetical protein
MSFRIINPGPLENALAFVFWTVVGLALLVTFFSWLLG